MTARKFIPATVILSQQALRSFTDHAVSGMGRTKCLNVADQQQNDHVSQFNSRSTTAAIVPKFQS